MTYKAELNTNFYTSQNLNNVKLSKLINTNGTEIKQDKTNSNKFTVTCEVNLVELSDDFADDDYTQNENPGTADSPREVVISSKPTDEQQKKIDTYIDLYTNKLKGNGYEVKDNILYKDEDGNPVKQVTYRENANGDRQRVTIEYDEKGRVKSTYVEDITKGKDGKYRISDGDKHTFTYNDDGSVEISQSYEYGNVKVMVASVPVVIEPDGSTHPKY